MNTNIYTCTPTLQVSTRFKVGDVVTNGNGTHRKQIAEITVKMEDDEPVVCYGWESGSYGHVHFVDEAWSLVMERNVWAFTVEIDCGDDRDGDVRLDYARAIDAHLASIEAKGATGQAPFTTYKKAVT